MIEQRFNPDHKRVIDALLDGVPGVTARKTFGQPAYYVRGKMFAALIKGGLALKLPQAEVDELLTQGHQPWRHGASPVKGWVVITVDDAETYRDHLVLLERSVGYVLEQAQLG